MLKLSYILNKTTIIGGKPLQYMISFLEGVITFISPCLLPMLPIYISYFANGENNKKRTFLNAMGFVLGFTIVFVSLGAFAGTLGGFLSRYRTQVNFVTGLIVILLGCNFAGVIRIGFLNGVRVSQKQVVNTGFFSSLLFGMIFSIGWTPCVGTFLGSALMLASQKGTILEGITLLILYSVGLGIPFLISAVLIDQLKGTFDVIKRHFKLINVISGILLIIVGLFMMTGMMGTLLSFLR